jgi:hypothetical protein
MINSSKILVLDPQREFSSYLSQLLPLLGHFELEHCESPLSLAAKATIFDTRMVVCDAEFIMQKTALFNELFQKYPSVLFLLIGTLRPKNLPTQTEFIPRPLRLIDLGERVKWLLNAEKCVPVAVEHSRLLAV